MSGDDDMTEFHRRVSLRRAAYETPIELVLALILLVTGPRSAQLALTWDDRMSQGTITALPVPFALAWAALTAVAATAWLYALSLRITDPLRRPLEQAALKVAISAGAAFAAATAWSDSHTWWSWSCIALLTAGLALRHRKVGVVRDGLVRAGGGDAP